MGHQSAVDLPEGLWGQEIHWGLEGQEDPRDRDGWVKVRLKFLPPGTQGTEPHSPSLRVARGDRHHLMFPVRE